jgi:hypothetical protein
MGYNSLQKKFTEKEKVGLWFKSLERLALFSEILTFGSSEAKRYFIGKLPYKF